jgi:hypothetical protein
MVVLNEFEIAVLNACVSEIMSCTGGEFGYSDDVEVEGLTKKQIGGYLSQLSQKKVISIYDDWKQMHLKELAEQYVDVKNCELN